MSESQLTEVHAHVIPSSGQDDDVISRDKGTSPFQEETEIRPTVEMKTFRIHSRPPQIKQTPHYPFETGNNAKQGRVLNRSTIHNGLLRSNRLQDYSYPSVVSSTQQLLCLTPSRGGVITLGSDDDVNRVARLNENNPVTLPARKSADHDNETPVPLATTIVTKTSGNDKQQHGNNFYRLMQKSNSPRPRTSTAHGHPFSLANIHYKHTTQIRKPYRYPALSPSAVNARKTDGTVSRTPVFERNATAMSMAKSPANTTFKIIENHVRWNRRLPVFNPDDAPNVYPYQPCFTIHDPGAQSRKMAPVLRVIPAFPQTSKIQQQRRVKVAKSPVDTEGASQKKVRFTDQIGLPLVRNATPNYRRKHSYILRWLETAGRPAKTIPLV
uniref:uncharacterized protein LOC120346396 n=1 Tax=Styela clava TaxID=7725 RepID=UPI001939455F|nr:uncharacterized protein LOC120346396 [Styela clava]